jgi:3',5'-cyclic AMP phosphodiesterase CpdA
MSVLLQVSDPHFGTEQAPVVEALVRFTHALSPDLLVVSGDITQRARARQFAAAAAFVRRLNVPRCLAIPGNHDIPLFDLARRFANPYAGFRAAFGDELEPTFQNADCLVLGVKTTRRYRHVDGEISAEQRERIASALRGARPGQLRVVVVHQPVAVPTAAEEHNVVHGAKDAVRAWADAGADIVLGGHIHLPFVLPLHEVMAPLPRPIWAVNAGTAVSHRTRQRIGNSVNVLRTAADRPRACSVEHFVFDAAHSDFERTSSVVLG